MTYEDAMDEETVVSRKEVERECARHSLDLSDLLAELGDFTEYKSRDVLVWFGY
jgi:hypothetical protein